VSGYTAKKVLCAPDSFKESLSAPGVAGAMVAGVRQANAAIDCDPCPIADGGEGSLEVLSEALGGMLHRMTVTGPLGEPVVARYGISGDESVGVVELAEASGLGLVAPAARDPDRTTSFGTGELIAAAAERGCETVIVCLGGSATIDGGAGIAQALGGVFVDRNGRAIDTPMTGGRLGDVAGYHAPDTGLVRLRVACDVTNPLLGVDGAACCYGPQKGATPRQVVTLDAQLARLAALLGGDPDRTGAGAAGGAGWGLAAMLGAELERGVDLILDAVDFNARCAAADLVLTGEGRLDAQSRRGKACFGVAEVAGAMGVPVVAIVGQAMAAASFDDLFAEVISLSDRFGSDRARRRPEQAITEAVRELLTPPA
jgi:glycerate kinase